MRAAPGPKWYGLHQLRAAPCQIGVDYSRQGHRTGAPESSDSEGVALINYQTFLHLLTSYGERAWDYLAAALMLTQLCILSCISYKLLGCILVFYIPNNFYTIGDVPF